MLALVVSLPVISTIAATGINTAVAFKINNKNEKIVQQNLCTNRALCQNISSQAPRNSLEQHPSGSWLLPSTSPSTTPSLGKIATPGITMSDVSNKGPSSANSVIATIPVGNGPAYVALDTANGDLYVANNYAGSVSIISGETNQVIGTAIPVGKFPFGIAYDSDNGNLYVANGGDDTVSIISGQNNTVIGKPIPVCSAPEGIAFDQANNNLYVACGRTNAVDVISGQTNQVVGNPIAVGHGATGITFDPSNDNMYVSNDFDATVSVISTQNNTVIGKPIPVGIGPYLIAFDSFNGNLYVVNNNDKTVSIISGHNNIVIGNPISVGVNPFGIAFDSANGNLYVTNSNPGTVSVISGHNNTVIGNPISVGLGAFGITFDPANNNLYVANQATNTVSVIATLPSGPPHASITSVIDDNGANVENGNTTLSTSIHITFTGQPGTSPISGFLCTLDGSKLSNCTSPFVASDLAAGKQHTFQVTAVDTLGNKDPTPAQFSWTVLTPAQGVEQLIVLIKSMGLAHGVQSALIAHLNGALQLLSHKQSKGACIQLDGFTKQVQVEVRVHQLNTANALQLIQSAQAIQNALGCKQ